MKTSRRLHRHAPPMGITSALRSRARREDEKGIAIITVLAVLLLMSVLVLAFFQMASNEFTASNNYEYSIRSRQAADTVISMVTGQIRKATTQTDKGGAGLFSWASQPGAITTFRTKSEYQEYEDAAFLKYKLYSSDSMIADGDYNLSRDVPSDWDEHPENWVDLNAPVIEETSDVEPRLHFPIIDPRAFVGNVDDSKGVANQDGVAGFGFTQETSAGETIPGIQRGSGSNARLPMPVRWLYMLADGSIGHLDDTGKFVRSFGEGEANKDNPITQRFAFWTDDESSKINVNTASEGQYWDYPSTASGADKNFAKHLPAQNELQRFPGQPAKTSLSVVFDSQARDNDTQLQREIYNAAPKVQWGGTENGTKVGTQAVKLDGNRLYATEDDYLFASGIDSGANSTKKLRARNTLFNNTSSPEELEQARFFLTANSSAPETTLFGTPRVSMWGMPEGGRSAFDSLIAYCSTLPKPGVNGSKEYFFNRSDSGSRHHEMYVYSNRKNIDLLEQYFYPMTSINNPIPGYGGTFAAKYGAGLYQDRRQICAEALDYLRNINVAQGSYYNSGVNNRAYGQTASCCICGGAGPHNTVWSQQRNSHPKGFGRMYTLSEASLVFLCTADANPNGSKGSVDNLRGVPPNSKRIQAALVLEAFCPNHGYTGIIPNTRMQVIDGSKPLLATDNTRTDPPPINTAGAASNWWVQATTKAAANGQAPYVVGNVSTNMSGRHTWGGTSGMRMFLTNNNQGSGQGISWKTSDPSLPAIAQDGHIIVSNQASSINIAETTMRIILYDEDGGQSTGNLIQVFDVVFPSMNIPIPKFTDDAHAGWDKRIALSNKPNGEDDLIMGGESEVVRSVVVSHGDYRLVSARRVSKKLGRGDIFQPHPDYSGNMTHAHSLVRGDGSPVKGAKMEPLVRGVSYAKDVMPDFPMSPKSPNYNTYGNPSDPYYYQTDPAESGDFDTGLGIAPDGAYINRPDEGSAVPNGEAYFNHERMKASTNLTPQLLTPNRIISSPVQFGSLSTGVQAGVPWRTLLFRPDPMHFGAKHNSAVGMVPPDHLFLDLFWMPIVEPYAISAPFATAGKVNLNCQIVPFDYIKRQTALHAVLKGERVTAIGNGEGSNYKTGGSGEYRYPIDAEQTLKQMEHRFERGELFRSGTEVCELYLVPEGTQLGEPDRVRTPGGDGAYDYPNMRQYWDARKLTGDNLKERTYSSIYPRVTTKSNAFRVHMIVQHLKKARSSEPDTFDPDKDRITSQWRGSAIIERNIDPNDARIPSYFSGGDPDAKISKPSLEYFYNYRVLNVKQFSP